MTDGQREVTDSDGITWTCIQAFAGLGNDPKKREAAQVSGSGAVEVVCTPSGGARSCRIAVAPDWQTLDEKELLARIEAARET